jgi:nickel/cobalt transporter (NicO) family protein
VNFAPELLLISAVVVVGVLHTIVPDHWVPITLLARQQGWSRRETARAALQAGIGHVGSTLALALVVAIAGVAFAIKFGHVISIVSSIALIAFGAWIAIGSWREMRSGGHGHSHDHGHTHGHGHGHDQGDNGPHGPERNTLPTAVGLVELSIFEKGVPPRFRLTGPQSGVVSVETIRDDGSRQTFDLVNLGLFWESETVIPEPHQFTVELTISNNSRDLTYSTRFEEHHHDGHHAHHDDDALYVPLRREVAGTHVHAHRHGSSAVHAHCHDHDRVTVHVLSPEIDANPPVHAHSHRTSGRMALLLILGSSPMVEGIPAFFAAAQYGIGLLAAMAFCFALSTIATYVVLCVYSTAGLQRAKLGAFERYGEVLSGAFIAAIGLVFLFVPAF